MRKTGLPRHLWYAPHPRQAKAPASGSVFQRKSRHMKSQWIFTVLILILVSGNVLCFGQTFGCTPAMANDVVCENSKPGNPSSQWDISGYGDPSIQGFATDISVNQGGTIYFKVNTTASAYTIYIYRIGYYGGLGARLVATLSPSVPLPQKQPSCDTNSSVGLFDCGNWAVSASWAVPSNATSGVYVAKLVRTDTGGASHIIFVVRKDSGTSNLLFKTSDSTWQAYNWYGGSGTGAPGQGQSLYGCAQSINDACRAFKVSYNRPFDDRGTNTQQDFFFAAEYPMVRWLEANGYDVSYISSIDADRNSSLLLQHKALLSVGHDEYWSPNMRSGFETARGNGIHLGFFSGNEMFWKIRWENSIDGSNTAYRTEVCYKETKSATPIDPLDPPTWTGTWRDPSLSPPDDGGRPPNALTGTLFMINDVGETQSIIVPQADGKMRFWRNTAVANLGSGQSYTFSKGTLGFEWDEDVDNGLRPPGTFWVSTATYTQTSSVLLLDYGQLYGTGTATHHATLYRHPSGALVFGAGTVQWSWGLDSTHDISGTSSDVNLQQATVNLFADMGIQPATLQSGLLATTASTDTTPPTSVITSPSSGTTVAAGTQVTVKGTATDSGGGVVAGVEVSVNGGATWHPAIGRGSWTYTWAAAPGIYTIQSRAVDDSGNLETPAPGVTLNVTGSPYTLSFNLTPVNRVLSGEYPIGVINWTPGSWWISGPYGPFSTTSVSFATALPSSAPFQVLGNYNVVSIVAGNGDSSSATVSLSCPGQNTVSATVGSGQATTITTGWTSACSPVTVASSNGWNTNFDNLVINYVGGSTATLKSIAVTPANPSIQAGSTQQFTATGTYSDGSTQNITTQVNWSSSNTGVATINSSGLASAIAGGSSTIAAAESSISGSTTLTVQPVALVITTTSLPNGIQNQPYSATLAATGGTAPYTWSLANNTVLPAGLNLSSGGQITGTPTVVGTGTFTVQVQDAGSPKQTATQQLSITITAAPAYYTIWSPTTVPGTVDQGDANAIELGVKFTASVNGNVTGVRFYKSSNNTGTHIGNLWTTGGTLLGSATFTNETASGWQQVNFSTPVGITANTVYVASYHTNVGHYSDDQNYFATSGVSNPPLTALANGVNGGDGVYTYGSTSAFPTSSYLSSNYWVDVVFAPSATLSSIAVTPANPSIAAGSTQPFTATGTYSDGSTQNITNQVTWSSSNTAVATISSSGLASGIAGGTSTITAAQSSVSGSTILTVQPASLVITTTSLPNGLQNQPYSATLTSTGGTPPNTWSLANSTTLPAGLTLSSGGQITGTPTVAGTTTFTVQVKDSGSPAQTATQSLSITIAASACPCSISGTISGTGGNGATVTLSGTSSATVTANSSGAYIFTGLGIGSYTVTPSHTGYIFTPANQPVTIGGANVTGVNFTSTAQLAIDKTVTKGTSSTVASITSPSFSTSNANELLLAFIATGGPTSTQSITSVTGAGLTWSLVKRTNVQYGTAEIWRAFAPTTLSNVSVKATLSQSNTASITVMTFSGVDASGTGGSGAVGATGTGNADPGAPTASLTTTRNNSWVIGVGNDWDNAIDRTLGGNQTMVFQYLTTAADTFWVQQQSGTTPTSGTVVTINDTAPNSDRYNLSICEILPAP
jgi:hypothetical protein